MSTLDQAELDRLLAEAKAQTLDDADALEMAGAALVSMSPGGMAHSPVRSRDDGDARRAHLVQQPFGSPTPSPGRRRGEKKGRALFPPEPAERGAADDDAGESGRLLLISSRMRLLCASASASNFSRSRRVYAASSCRSCGGESTRVPP